MKKRLLLSGFFLALSITAVAFAAGPPVAPNGIALIEGYRDWQVIAPSYRPDKGHIRVVLGNATAISAFREGKRPFPDGTIFAKVAWNATKHPKFPVAVVPGAFAQVEFMVKDSVKYKKTGGGDSPASSVKITSRTAKMPALYRNASVAIHP